MFIKNEIHSSARDGFTFWQTKGPSAEIADLTVSRNGQDGIRWGYYRSPHRVFQLRAIENGDDGVGAGKFNKSGNRYILSQNEKAFGSISISLTASEGIFGEIGNQELPPFVDFHAPPLEEPA